MIQSTDNGVDFELELITKTNKMDNRKEIIENILGELNGRSGFDDWWYNIDEDIQEEITEALVNLLPIQIVSCSTETNSQN